MPLTKEMQQKLHQIERGLTRYCLMCQKTDTTDQALQERVKAMKQAIAAIRPQVKDVSEKTGGDLFASTGEQQIGNKGNSKSSGKNKDANALHVERFVKPKGGGVIDVEQEKVDQANKIIGEYGSKKESTEQFKHYDKQQFIASLKKRIADPKRLYQHQLNLCGAAAFAVSWIERDPAGYTKTMIDVFEKGKGNYNGIPLKVNPNMYKQRHEQDKHSFRSSDGNNFTIHQEFVDWLTLASLQNAANGGALNLGLIGAGYDPKNEWGGLRGIGHPDDVLKWFKSLSSAKTLEFADDKDLSHGTLNNYLSKNYHIVFLVYTGILFRQEKGDKTGKWEEDIVNKINHAVSDPIAAAQGNHYVVLNGPIKDMDVNGTTYLDVDVWTWGGNFRTQISTQDFRHAIKRTFVIPPE